MQVPEQFFYGRNDGVKKTDATDPEEVRRAMAQARRETRQQSDVGGRRRDSKSFDDVAGGLAKLKDYKDIDIEDEDNTFSLFSAPPKSTKAAKPMGMDMPQLADAEEAVKDGNEETPIDVEGQNQFVSKGGEKHDQAVAKGQELPKEESIPLQAVPQKQADKTNTEKQVANLHQTQEYTPVKKQEKAEPKKEVQSPIQDFASQAKETKPVQPQQPSKASQGESVKESQTAYEEIPVDANEIEQRSGKQMVREKNLQPQRFIPIAGNAEQQHAHDKVVAEQNLPELKNLQGEKPVKNVKDEPILNRQRVEKEASVNDEQATQKSEKKETKASDTVKEGFIDPRTVAQNMPFTGGGNQFENLISQNDKVPEQPRLLPKLQEIVNKLVQEINVISQNGNTETTITLNNPALFNGVKVTITTSDTAPKEMNITFSNLTGPGKRLMDEHIGALRAGLENNEKGFVVQQIITTTVNEPPRYTSEAGAQQQRNPQDNPDENPRKRQQNQEDDEEEDIDSV